MHRRKMANAMLILLSLVLLLSASSLHVTKGIRIAEAVTKTVPQLLHKGRQQTVPMSSSLPLQNSPRSLGTSLVSTEDMPWYRTYGGSSWDYAYSVIQTPDGGFALAGYTYSYGIGEADFWLVKTDTRGTVDWTRTYGGPETDEAYAIIKTADGGFALAGWTNSYGAGGFDFWLVKTDVYGNMQWARTYGGPKSELLESVIQTADGGFALAGCTSSYGEGCVNSHFYDAWLVKTDVLGNMVWQWTYSGGGDDYAKAVIQTADGGLVLAGITNLQVSGYDNNMDAWLVKTDTWGEVEWVQTYNNSQINEAFAVIETADGGFAIAGSIGDTISFRSIDYNVWLAKTDAYGVLQWNRTYGGTKAFSVIQTVDGGFALADLGARLVKTDVLGAIEWIRTCGGRWNPLVFDGIQTTDGGFALTGYTKFYGAGEEDFWLVKTPPISSWPPTLSNIHATSITNTNAVIEWRTDVNTTAAWVEYDFTTAYGASVNVTNVQWILGSEFDFIHTVQLTDLTPETSYHYCVYARGTGGVSASRDHTFTATNQGVMYWNRTYGGNGGEAAFAVIQTADGGFALGGWTNSYGTGGEDFWLVKTNAYGVVQWQQTYGGSEDDLAYTIIQTIDGGFVLAGYTRSFWVAGYCDSWLVKTDAHGVAQWNRTYGGSKTDKTYAIIQTADGGYTFAGWTNSYGASNCDFWLVKTDNSGEVEWNRTYGGSKGDEATAVIQTVDGGYALTGWTLSYKVDLERDFWLVKTDNNGITQWNQTYGGPFEDRASSIIQITDGGFVLAGSTGGDAWLVKTDARGVSQWNRTYGGSKAHSMIQTEDRGFILAGSTGGDAWLVKTDALGEMEWTRIYGGSENDNIYTVIQTADGGFALAGVTQSYGAGGEDAWLVKTIPHDFMPPELSSPTDIAYAEGATGNIIIWTVKDRHPGTYAIYTNSEQVCSGSWTNGSIPWNVDGFIQGTYNVTMVVWDAAGKSVSNTVWVTVTASKTPPLSELPVIRTIVLLSLVASTILCVRRKKSNTK